MFDRIWRVDWKYDESVLFNSDNQLKSKILNENEIEVFYQDLKSKYIRICKIGFNKWPYGKPWTFDRVFSKEEYEGHELFSYILVLATNDENDWEIIKQIEED